VHFKEVRFLGCTTDRHFPTKILLFLAGFSQAYSNEMKTEEHDYHNMCLL